MISMKNIAVTASFMAIGMSRNDEARYNKLLEAWGNGCLELHYELSEYAVLSEKIVDFLVEECCCEFPGVYDYEVSEPFGEWFGDYVLVYKDVPGNSEAVPILIHLACKFFAQGGGMPADQLAAKVHELISNED